MCSDCVYLLILCWLCYILREKKCILEEFSQSKHIYVIITLVEKSKIKSILEILTCALSQSLLITFPKDKWCWETFPMFIGCSHILFGGESKSLAYFKIICLLLNFKSWLHILELNLLPDISFASLFSQLEACLFIFLSVFYLSLCFQIVYILFKKSLPNLSSWKFCHFFPGVL